MKIRDRLERLLELKIVEVEAIRGINIPEYKKVIAVYDDGIEYEDIHKKAQWGRKAYECAKKILELEGVPIPKKSIFVNMHYLVNLKERETYRFDLPFSNYVREAKD
jgi:hypothetical protein